MNSDTPHQDATFRGFSSGHRVFGRFVLEKMVGRGGMGVVWSAHDTRLDQQVALKFLPDALFWDRIARQQIAEETRKARLLSHPHIVRIHDLFEDDQHAAICMEYVEGADLNALKSERPNGVFEAAELEGWVGEIAVALDYAHREVGVVHRDLKPANILITKTGKAKISDFGVARSIAETMTRVSTFSGAGTLAYMSPQQYDGDEPTPADDWYALGATLYDLITGRPPFFRGAVPDQIRNRRPETMTVRREQFQIVAAPVSPAWEALVAACLSKNPSDRPQGANQVERLLSGDVGRNQSSAKPRWSVRRSLFAVGLVVVGLGLGWAYLERPNSIESDPVASNASKPPHEARVAATLAKQSGYDTLVNLPLRQDILDAGPHALGTMVEGVRLVEDANGLSALRFDGHGHLETEPTGLLALEPSSSFRLSLWIKPDRDEARTSQVLSVLGREKVGEFFFFMGRDGDDLNVHLALTQMPVMLQIMAPASLRQGVWQQLEFEYSQGEAGLWIDGVMVGYNKTDLGAASSNMPARLRMGAAAEGPRGFVGAMRDVVLERIDGGPSARLAAAEMTSWWEQVPSTAVGAPFAVLEGRVSETEDLGTIVSHRFGDDASLAEWSAFKGWLESHPEPAEALDQMGLGFQENAFVTVNGEQMAEENRHFFVTRMNGTVPDYYHAYDTAMEDLVALGSWRGIRMPLLVAVESAGVFLPITDDYVHGRDLDYSAWRWLREEDSRVRAIDGGLEVFPGEAPLVLERSLQGGLNRDQMSLALQYRFGASLWGTALKTYFVFPDGSRVELGSEVVEGRNEVQAIRLVNGNGRSELREISQPLGSQELVISLQPDRLRGSARETANRQLLFESSLEVGQDRGLPVSVGLRIYHPNGAPIRIDWIKFSAAIGSGFSQQ